MSYALFKMWQPLREHLIARHNFFMEQAQKRLLTQFQNIEAEADEYGNNWLSGHNHYFDPDRHDPGSFLEQAYDESIGFYSLLSDMQINTRLSVVAGMFHEWDKQLRDWTLSEINHWHHGEAVKKAVWKANFFEIIGLFEGFGWAISQKNYYKSINKCRLVVNAYKHGYGSAFESIRKEYPEFIDLYNDLDPIFLEMANYTNLTIEDKHIIEFSNSIVDFWNDVPEYMWMKNTLVLPQWFENACKNDQQVHRLG
jgi:hypothetical protein